MTRKKFFSIARHPTTIKIVMVLVIVWVFFVVPTFAQETTSDTLEDTKTFLNNLLSLCSRWWIIMAILAGKLMTNDRVYGSIIHMDIYLRKIRNIMKNFANFALVGIVLFNIIKNLVGKEKLDVKDIIIKTIVAGVLIQASRFLMAALIDISTIATSAVSSFPSSFLSSSANLEKQIKDSLTVTPKRYLIDPDKLNVTWSKVIEPIDNAAVDTTTRDQILPTYNSVSGPLVYFGMSVFRFQNYVGMETTSTGKLTIAFLLRLFLILAFTVGLALLFIANIIRVGFLRVFVIATPLIVLIQIFSKSKSLEWENAKWLGEFLNFKTMIDLIFKPVIFVAGLSMILILVVSMQNIMQGTLPKSFNNVSIAVKSWASTLSVQGITNIEVKENEILWENPLVTWSQIKDVGQSIFAELILFFLTIFLMRQFIKITLTSGKWPIAKVMWGEGGLIRTMEKMAASLPLIPMGAKGLASFTTLASTGEQNKKKILQWLWFNPEQGANFWKIGQFYGEEGNKQFQTNEEKFNKWINSKFNLQEPWTNSDREELDKLSRAENYKTFFTRTQELAADRQWGMTIETNEKRKTALSSLLKKSTATTDFGFSKPMWASQTLDDYFKNKPKDVKNLYKKLWGDAATWKSLENSITRDQLKTTVFYPTAQ